MEIKVRKIVALILCICLCVTAISAEAKTKKTTGKNTLHGTMIRTQRR